ncbi:hypothetical protein [Salmonirosea aquatica]|uniref:Low affinity iron permease family protein n=1 Tax=Salmonirosea aquatica TaxID=2654236 RepID=A0A7C9BKW8_9BACT|nr:hypothetical protein [Cytophagaceae bacterium SJW1-29]
MSRLFAHFTDSVEWLLSQWWGFGAYLALSWITYHAWGWDGIDRFTYMANGVLVIMLLNNARRDSKATHKKLDAADPQHHEGLEARTEEEIDRCD